MVGVVEGFRWALLGKPRGAEPADIRFGVGGAGVLLGGLFYFRRMEQQFADVV